MRAPTSIALAFAALAAFASLASAQRVVPWSDRGTPFEVAVNCSETVRFRWSGSVHELEHTTSMGCESPVIKAYTKAEAGDVTLAYVWPGSYYYKCDVEDHCTVGKQLAEVKVGQCGTPGVIPWFFRRDNASYAPITVKCGATVNFVWTSGRHDVVEIAQPSCGAEIVKSYGNGTAMDPSSTGNVAITYTKAGVHHYECSVAAPANHCALGRMLLTVHVAGPCAGDKKPVARPPPSRRPPPRKFFGVSGGFVHKG